MSTEVTHSEHDPLIGSTIDKKYKIEQRIGIGGMGAVYKAEHVLMRRVVAIKVLRSDLSAQDGQEDYFRRFEREAYTASQIDHPNAVTIHDYGIDNGMPYIVMKFVSGTTLRQVIDESKVLPFDRILNIVRQTAEAIAVGHRIGIVHRDLKPENIMITAKEDGTDWVEVLDFGIAKVADTHENQLTAISQTGCIVGSPHYMSPEQIMAKDIGPGTDIYALATITYRMLSGAFPFEGESPMELLTKQAYEAPTPLSVHCPDISRSIEQTILKGLHKAPSERHGSIEAFVAEFRAAIQPPKRDSNISNVPVSEKSQEFQLGKTQGDESAWTIDASEVKHHNEEFQAVKQAEKPQRNLYLWVAGCLIIIGAGALLATRPNIIAGPENNEELIVASSSSRSEPSPEARNKLMEELTGGLPKELPLPTKPEKAQKKTAVAKKKLSQKPPLATKAAEEKVKIAKVPEKKNTVGKFNDEIKSPASIDSVGEIDPSSLPSPLVVTSTGSLPTAAGYIQTPPSEEVLNTTDTDSPAVVAPKIYIGTLQEVGGKALPMQLSLNISEKDITGSASIGDYQTFRVRGKIFARGIEIEMQNETYYLRLTGTNQDSALRGILLVPSKTRAWKLERSTQVAPEI